MPLRLYDFAVLDEQGNPTNEVIEELVKRGTEYIKDDLGRIAKRKGVQLLAYTPTLYGDSKSRYDAALGCVVRSQRDIDRICKEKGLTPVNDLPNGTAERLLTRQINHHEFHKKEDARWDDLAQKHGLYEGEIDPTNGVNIKACARVWSEFCPAGEVANGTWNEGTFESF